MGFGFFFNFIFVNELYMVIEIWQENVTLGSARWPLMLEIEALFMQMSITPPIIGQSEKNHKDDEC